jgi:hypothetical protein
VTVGSGYAEVGKNSSADTPLTGSVDPFPTPISGALDLIPTATPPSGDGVISGASKRVVGAGAVLTSVAAAFVLNL